MVTGSCLEQTSADLPSDLYFYAPAGSGAAGPPDYGERGVALADQPDMLLDVVMGSGSVFPVFPPRTLENFPRPGERIELIDGGFVHNSPVEAAVRWGATHVVLIEADPHERAERRNFLQNAAGAFNHLYYQAQQVDARSREREQVVIFSLRPDPPHICMLDFADNLIDLAIEKGYREARGESSPGAGNGPVGVRRFRKELGQPMFWRQGPGVGGRGSGKAMLAACYTHGTDASKVKYGKHDMTTKHLVVEGTVKPDGSLELDARLTLPPGRVQLVVQPLPELPKDDPFWQRMKQVWAGQKARGRSPRSKEEIDADIHALRDEAEDEMRLAERLHEERCAASRGTDQTKGEPPS